MTASAAGAAPPRCTQASDLQGSPELSLALPSGLRAALRCGAPTIGVVTRCQVVPLGAGAGATVPGRRWRRALRPRCRGRPRSRHAGRSLAGRPAVFAATAPTVGWGCRPRSLPADAHRARGVHGGRRPVIGPRTRSAAAAGGRRRRPDGAGVASTLPPRRQGRAPRGLRLSAARSLSRHTRLTHCTGSLAARAVNPQPVATPAAKYPAGAAGAAGLTPRTSRDGEASEAVTAMASTVAQLGQHLAPHLGDVARPQREQQIPGADQLQQARRQLPPRRKFGPATGGEAVGQRARWSPPAAAARRPRRCRSAPPGRRRPAPGRTRPARPGCGCSGGAGTPPPPAGRTGARRSAWRRSPSDGGRSRPPPARRPPRPGQ